MDGRSSRAGMGMMARWGVREARMYRRRRKR